MSRCYNPKNEIKKFLIRNLGSKFFDDTKFEFLQCIYDSNVSNVLSYKV